MTTLRGNLQDDDVLSAAGTQGRKIIRWLLIVLAFIVGWLILTSIGRVTRIDAGHVGIEINLAGSQRGASDTHRSVHCASSLDGPAGRSPPIL